MFFPFFIIVSSFLFLLFLLLPFLLSIFLFLLSFSCLPAVNKTDPNESRYEATFFIVKINEILSWVFPN